MVIVDIRDGKTSFALYADLSRDGDLVIAGRDHKPELDAGADAYEYLYTVGADAVPRVCELLGVDDGSLLDGVLLLLAPHGVAASAHWRSWLNRHQVPYGFSLR
jgi:hypothetical protein